MTTLHFSYWQRAKLKGSLLQHIRIVLGTLSDELPFSSLSSKYSWCSRDSSMRMRSMKWAKVLTYVELGHGQDVDGTNAARSMLRHRITHGWRSFLLALKAQRRAAFRAKNPRIYHWINLTCWVSSCCSRTISCNVFRASASSSASRNNRRVCPILLCTITATNLRSRIRFFRISTRWRISSIVAARSYTGKSEQDQIRVEIRSMTRLGLKKGLGWNKRLGIVLRMRIR